jgi:hypothetical protein
LYDRHIKVIYTHRASEQMRAEGARRLEGREAEQEHDEHVTDRQTGSTCHDRHRRYGAAGP